MGTEWIPVFQQQIENVAAQIHHVQRTWRDAGVSHAPHEMQRAADEIDKFCMWARALPRDDAVWAIVDRHEMQIASVTHLSLVIGHLYYVTDLRAKTPRAAAIHALEALVDGAVKAINTLPPPYEKPRDDCSFSKITPDMLLRVLHVNLYSLLVTQWHVSPMPPGVQIEYHPCYTQRMICHMVHQFDRWFEGAEIHLMAESTAESLIMKLTSPDLRMSPVPWQAFFDSMRTFRDMTLIHVWDEIGGRLEPLAWDEGQGEGMIIRLPWAKTS